MENLTEISRALEACETKMDIPGSLPIEIFHEILLYLPSHDLYNAWKCCTNWKDRMESFWQKKCRIEHYFECEDDLKSKFYRNFMTRFSHWEGIYMYNSKLRENWINLNYKEIVVQHDFTYWLERGIKSGVYYISDDVIIATAGTVPRELLIINCTTGVVEKRLCPHFDQSSGYVFVDALDIIEKHLIVVWEHRHYDETNGLKLPVIMYLTVWNMETGELLIKSEREIFQRVLKVIIYKDIVTLITDPCGTYIFNIKKDRSDYEQHCGTSACHYNDKIILGDHAGTILMMDLEYVILLTLECCTDERTITNVVMEGNYLVSVCVSRKKSDYNHYRACIWNIETKTKLYELQDVARDDIKLFVDENKLCYSAKKSNDSIFKLCHLDTGKCLVELLERKYYVFTNKFLMLQQDRVQLHSLKMRSIKTGEVVADFDISFPYMFHFFNCGYIGTKKMKTKIALFEHNRGSLEFQETPLIVIDFQTKLEV